MDSALLIPKGGTPIEGSSQENDSVLSADSGHFSAEY